MQKQLKQVEAEALESLKNVENLAELESLRDKVFWTQRGVYCADERDGEALQ